GFPEAKPADGLLGRCEVLGSASEGNVRLLQLSSPQISKGFSGAPIWDDRRKVVIGMVTSIIGSRKARIAGTDLFLPRDSSGRQTETAFATPTETLWEVCPPLRASEICPYRGLDAFTEEHADLFFGRERYIEKLIDKLVQDIR